MQTGWRTASQARRPHHSLRLRRKDKQPAISRKRRKAARNSNAALRRKGLLP